MIRETIVQTNKSLNESIMRKLRNQLLTLRKPIFYAECVMIAEEIIKQIVDPGTVIEVLNSRESVHWSGVMDSEYN